jgi:hypothetical protein
MPISGCWHTECIAVFLQYRKVRINQAETADSSSRPHHVSSLWRHETGYVLTLLEQIFGLLQGLLSSLGVVSVMQRGNNVNVAKPWKGPFVSKYRRSCCLLVSVGTASPSLMLARWGLLLSEAQWSQKVYPAGSHFSLNSFFGDVL